MSVGKREVQDAHFMDTYGKFLARIPQLKRAVWVKCECGAPALSFAEGRPPDDVRKAWEGCTTFGHGAIECKTTGMIRMTQPIPSAKCKCWTCKDMKKRGML